MLGKTYRVKREKILLSIILACRLKKVFMLKPLSIFHNTFSKISEMKGLFVGLFCGELLNFVEKQKQSQVVIPYREGEI